MKVSLKIRKLFLMKNNKKVLRKMFKENIKKQMKLFLFNKILRKVNQIFNN